MSNVLFKGKEQIFRDVIGLAEDRVLVSERSGFDGGTINEIHEFRRTPEGRKVDVAEASLSDYLFSLSFDDVKMIQTVMYLGRDREYDLSSTPLEIYNEFNEYLDRHGWESKEIEANQILEKGPLADYLKSGLEILDVKI